jgi:hypothetical protein
LERLTDQGTAVQFISVTIQKAEQEVPLSFVRLEPFVLPKTSLTGVNTERVDTRVVQVIYAIDPENPLVVDSKILVGRLMDVFIDSSPSGQPEKDSGRVPIRSRRSRSRRATLRTQ